jgi:hypothetical protein
MAGITRHLAARPATVYERPPAVQHSSAVQLAWVAENSSLLGVEVLLTLPFTANTKQDGPTIRGRQWTRGTLGGGHAKACTARRLGAASGKT